ncbi:MAG: hypothetical protein HC915_13855 [Anaerolineae bacterium]|nr:hypothetical protein [Anaerolineae bacterium]
MVQSIESINYPDLLGAVTGGKRLNIDLVQCALSTRPDAVRAGQNFEVIFLIQNVVDVDVDVTVEMKLPERDLLKRRNMFYSKSSRILVGLQPAEVGYIILPASCSPKTEHGEQYSVSATVQVDRPDKHHKPQRIRGINGGGGFSFEMLPERTQQLLLDLRKLSWEVEHQAAAITSRRPLACYPPGWPPSRSSRWAGKACGP